MCGCVRGDERDSRRGAREVTDRVALGRSSRASPAV
jgi:hypothetical protein